MTQELPFIANAVLDKVAMAIILTYFYLRIKDIREELKEIRRHIENVDTKTDNIMALVKYLEGRVNTYHNTHDRSTR